MPPTKTPKMATVARPQGRMNKPLVDNFVYTGEKPNPWRCDSCVTPAQRRAAKRQLTTADLIAQPNGEGSVPYPGCCRKCGLDFYK